MNESGTPMNDERCTMGVEGLDKVLNGGLPANRLYLIQRDRPGYGQEADKVEAFKAGFDHHLIKPLSVKELKELLAQRTADS